MSEANAPVTARVRQLERHGAASLRALSGQSLAEYRASRLRIDGIPTPFAAPYLAIDFAQADLQRSRGVMDALGLRLRYSDQELHTRLTPATGFGRLVFDILEQTRCESLYNTAFRGIRENMDVAFEQWCHEAHFNGFCDSDMGILLYTVIHMIRARLIGTFEDETAEALIEATRANIAPSLGKSLYQLKRNSHDQTAFAVHAKNIADTLHQLVKDADTGEDNEDTAKRNQRLGIVLPPDWNDKDVDGEIEGAGAGTVADTDTLSEQLESLGDYHVYTSEYDQQVDGESLFRPDKRQRLRAELDRLVSAQAVSTTRLARELLSLLATPQVDGWLFGQDEGLIDARRLAQLVSNPEYHQVFVQEREQLQANTAVTFLIDNSGSMKRQRYATVAVLVDTFARALGLAGITTEVLGFTTADWNGGRALQDWRATGQAESPGRIGETLHIVYKSANKSWGRSRSSMASLTDTQHFREGIDGEALIWAYNRLLQREEQRRYLVVISDGAPMDSATHHANREGFLADHLVSVARFIERHGEVRLGAIGIDLDMSDTYRNAVSLDLSGTLGQASYRVLHTLFGSPVH